MGERVKLTEAADKHLLEMTSNLRMREDAERKMAWDSARRFLSEAADHAAIATAYLMAAQALKDQDTNHD